MSKLEYHRWLDLFEYIPKFRDSINTSSMICVKHVSQPGDSLAYEGVIEACNEYGMVMYFIGIKSFHH